MKSAKHSLRPLLSLIFILFTLFTLVFLKMETRRLGYVLLKQSREMKSLEDNLRQKKMMLAKMTGPERLRSLAINNMTLSDANADQIINMSGEHVAQRQKN